MIVPVSEESIKEAARRLQSGEVVAFPTETVYGLGANALEDSAVSKIFLLKSRPASNPIIVHVPTVEAAFELIHPDVDRKVIARFRKISRYWPGPLSLIVPKINEISDLVSAGAKNIAIRVPKHPVALELLKAARMPIAAPSANKSFAVSPTTAQHVKDSFAEHTIMILDGGPCEVGLESTVLDISGIAPQVMRPGAISREQMMHTLEEACVNDPIRFDSESDSEPARSPGLFDRHYAPHTPLLFIEDLANVRSAKNLGVILFYPERRSEFESKAKKVIVLSESGDLEEVARNLYDGLRKMDQEKVDMIAIESCSELGIGMAIMDRLRRARHLS